MVLFPGYNIGSRYGRVNGLLDLFLNHAVFEGFCRFFLCFDQGGDETGIIGGEVSVFYLGWKYDYQQQDCCYCCKFLNEISAQGDFDARLFFGQKFFL